MISAKSVRLSSLPKIVYEFHKFPAKNPGLLDLDHFLTVNTASAVKINIFQKWQLESHFL